MPHSTQTTARAQGRVSQHCIQCMLLHTLAATQVDWIYIRPPQPMSMSTVKLPGHMVM
ncbi:hypothetical protein K439DRAFT_1630015 [Ramaria rubella]|nr:hypothetical protein K439DRAFT_1630015 [Ramaria rubella]